LFTWKNKTRIKQKLNKNNLDFFGGVFSFGLFLLATPNQSMNPKEPFFAEVFPHALRSPRFKKKVEE